MTALMTLTARMRLARVALVVPPEAGAEAADFVPRGADLLILATGNRSVAGAAAVISVLRKRLFGSATLVATDRLDVGLACGADVVFLHRRSWRPFAPRKPHEYSLLGRPVTAAEAGRLDGDPFSFGFVRPAVTAGKVSAAVAEMALRLPPLAVPPSPAWFAAGGIDRGNVAEVLAAGARRVAVSGSVFGAADPLAECAAIADAVRAAWEADPAAAGYREAAVSG